MLKKGMNLRLYKALGYSVGNDAKRTLPYHGTLKSELIGKKKVLYMIKDSDHTPQHQSLAIIGSEFRPFSDDERSEADWEREQYEEWCSRSSIDVVSLLSFERVPRHLIQHFVNAMLMVE